ncbi:twin-arginine translocation signal domain-containing protein [Haladaptatus halobius]|nr:twin-arginine translocation signal domain-containing protein [Haladaptatus halobius]
MGRNDANSVSRRAFLRTTGAMGTAAITSQTASARQTGTTMVP